MRRILRSGSVSFLVGLSLAGAQGVAVPSGQQGGAQPEGPTGSVTGVVLAQDTQRPVRFAEVRLQRVLQPGADQTGQGFGNLSGGGPGAARTDVEGTFTLSGVAPGDYYALAAAPGYVSQGALLRSQVAAGGDPAALLAALPVVRVAADSSSNVTVSLQRGGVIAGHVEWEDGTPASGVSMNAALTASGPAMTQAMRGLVNFQVGQPAAQTDDRGNFRIAGLATGDYTVSATMQSDFQGGPGRGPRFPSAIRVYAPRAFRRADAKTIAVRAGDERTDVSVILDLRGLHTVSGHVNSANPAEPVARGNAQLADGNDNTLQIFGQVDAEGNFKLRYVPPGTYTLRITGANSQAQMPFRGGRGGQDNAQQPKGVAYQDFATTITVGDTDVTGVAVSLVPLQNQGR